MAVTLSAWSMCAYQHQRTQRKPTGLPTKRTPYQYPYRLDFFSSFVCLSSSIAQKSTLTERGSYAGGLWAVCDVGPSMSFMNRIHAEFIRRSEENFKKNKSVSDTFVVVKSSRRPHVITAQSLIEVTF